MFKSECQKNSRLEEINWKGVGYFWFWQRVHLSFSFQLVLFQTRYRTLLGLMLYAINNGVRLNDPYSIHSRKLQTQINVNAIVAIKKFPRFSGDFTSVFTSKVLLFLLIIVVIRVIIVTIILALLIRV